MLQRGVAIRPERLKWGKTVLRTEQPQRSSLAARLEHLSLESCDFVTEAGVKFILGTLPSSDSCWDLFFPTLHRCPWPSINRFCHCSRPPLFHLFIIIIPYSVFYSNSYSHGTKECIRTNILKIHHVDLWGYRPMSSVGKYEEGDKKKEEKRGDIERK